MNPKLTLTVEGNKIISAGTVSVGEKIDVKIIGLDSISIPDYDIGAQFSGSSLRFRIVDNSGHDLVRFPMNESDSWIVDEEQGVYNATDVDLNTDKLRNLFEGVAYGDKLQFGIILDSVVDSAQYARGKTYIQQWPMASIDDPKVLPDWGDVLLDLKADLGEVETFKITAEDAARETIGYRNDVFAAKSNVESKAAQVSDLEKKCELHEFKSMQYSQEADGAAERALDSENNAKGFSDTASSMAESAANSAKEAKETLANVVKKSGDTMTGRLTVPSITIGEDEPEDLFVLLGGEFDRVVNESALEVEAESKRAKDAEKVISDNLSEEIGNRKDADLALARKIDENTNSMSLKADLVNGKVPVDQLPNALVYPVYSINGKTGDVVLEAKDIKIGGSDNKRTVLDNLNDLEKKSFILSPDENTMVSADDDGTAKVKHTERTYGNATVAFPDGFSIGDTFSDPYVAPSGGETIAFYGPISSSSAIASDYLFWVPYEYKDSTDFDPATANVWCLYCSKSDGVPYRLMFGAGPTYDIQNWGSESPTLSLTNGEASGSAPTMARTVTGENDETKTLATTDDVGKISDEVKALGATVATKTPRMTIGTNVDPGTVTLEDNKITRVEITDAEATLDVILPEMKDGYLNYCEMLLIVAEGATSVDLITSANSIVYADSEDALVPEPGINHIVFSQVNAYEWVASRTVLANAVGGADVLLEKGSSTNLMSTYELTDNQPVGELATSTGVEVSDDMPYGVYVQSLNQSGQ